MTRFAPFALALAAACLAAAAQAAAPPLATKSAAAPAASVTRHTVTMENFQFNPPSITVKPGDTVEWVNKDILAHTATATDRAFDSKSIDAGASWSWTAGKPGSYGYYCTFHPNMTAVVEVR
jgi:plastocyanin